MAFSIALIILLGLGGDYLFRRLKLPGLVGMLLMIDFMDRDRGTGKGSPTLVLGASSVKKCWMGTGL
ncbi:MAG: hypothetical protein ABF292_01850 [Desulfobacterales bacterium]